MLDALYGTSMVKNKQNSSSCEITIDVDKMHGGHSSFTSEDAASTISSTMLNDYIYKFTTRVNPDGHMADSTKCSSTSPIVMIKYPEIDDCQEAPSKKINSEMQNDILSHGHSPSSVIRCNNQMLPKDASKCLDTRPYVSLSKNSKKCSAAIDASDHGEYIEYDDITPKRAVTGQSHGSES